MEDLYVVYITCSSKDEALHIGKKLVESRLAACVNIIDGMTSMYWWEGKVVDDTEVILIAKTSKKHYPELESTVKTLHSYTVPCVIALPIVEGSPAYTQWLQGELKDA